MKIHETNKPRTDRAVCPRCGTVVWKAANSIESFAWSLLLEGKRGCCSDTAAVRQREARIA